ncbi:MAG: ABC transporter permease, partial [Oscillospiraceae bacterium]|nr:ABC transporter permease [Oscillospiraceae bacterium]
FFVVAILVSLTTMSRMVEERRTQIGIYKALGYRPAAIMLKYGVYAVASGFIGGIIGVAAGSVAFPRIIADAYGHLYSMPPVETPIPLDIAAFAVTVSVVSVAVVTLAVCAGTMADEPASLMRPRAPKAGKRVLIEKIPFIWNRLGFIGKVTARNILRYKRRFLMTLSGVAGCTALLLTAFGLRDSIGGVARMQYGDIIMYDAVVYVKEVTAPERRAALDALTPGARLYVREESVKTEPGGLSAALVVPEEPDALGDFIRLFSPSSGKPAALTGDGALITEKLARSMGVQPGGSFTLTAGDGSGHTVTVAGIVENYILHFIYMTPGYYAELFGGEPRPNSLLALGDADAEALMRDDGVRAVILTDNMRVSMSDSTDAMGIVTIVLIILACALAFVVLFNLTVINITERTRELATIKVLGFQDTELAMYMYRENVAVTLIGIILGLIAGIYLETFVLSSVEIDLLKFPHIIRPASFILAAALSLAFALFVNAVTYPKLTAIDMVESLKNVE